MNLNHGSSQILAPLSNRAAPSLRNPDSLSLSDAHAPAQSERERASPVGENGTEMVCYLLLIANAFADEMN